MPVLPLSEIQPEISTLFNPGFVDAPSTTGGGGGPLPFGLMSVAQLIPGGDGATRWHQGITFQGNPCDRARSTIGPCPEVGQLDFTKAITSDGLPSRGAETFSVYANIACSPVGFWDDANARAVAALINGEQRAMERAFWTGEIDDPGGVFIHPHLASNITLNDPTGLINLQSPAEILVTGVVDVVEGIGIMEQALAECFPGNGVIHAPRELLAHMSANNLVVRVGQQLQTWGGTKLAFGAGYTGSSPAGADPTPGTTWIYGTGAVMIRRDTDVTLTSDRTAALDRSVNTLRIFAERAYNISWDCCHFALQVSLGGAITGTPFSAT